MNDSGISRIIVKFEFAEWSGVMKPFCWIVSSRAFLGTRDSLDRIVLPSHYRNLLRLAFLAELSSRFGQLAPSLENLRSDDG